MIFCIFGGSNPGNNPRFAEVSKEFISEIAERGHSFVYGGGSDGIMGLTATTALEKHAHVTGIIPQFLMTAENAKTDIDELIVTDTLYERLELMMQKSDVIVALPGGFGTMQEFFTAITKSQLGRHEKPLVIVNVDGYYNPLISLVRTIMDEDFAPQENSSLFIEVTSPQELFEELPNFKPNIGNKFKGRENPLLK